MHGQRTVTFPSPASRRVLTVTGQGVSLRVRERELQVTDGFPLEAPQETRRVTRARSRLDRLLLTAGSGWVSLDALDWCAENSVPIVAVSQSGAPRWTLLPGAGGAYQSALRRSQALAPFTDTGAEIARWLIRRKIAGQRDVLRDLLARLSHAPHDAWPHTSAHDAERTLDALSPRTERAASIFEARQIEADAAATYWSAWAGLLLHFTPPSYSRKVPDHWRTFRERGSPLNQGNRNAADPANALLNYAYALLEAEARIACHEAGLDPALGVLHTDTDSRLSLIYDLMESARPIADRLVLTLLMTHAFRPGELWALRDGRCRLDQDLCATLWPWMPEFRRALGPVMAFLLGRLRGGPRYGERRAFRLVPVAPEVRTRAPLGQKRWAREAPPPALRVVNACRTCGVLLEDEDPDRLYCDTCFPARREEANAAILQAGAETLRRLRERGQDPAHGGTAADARRKMLVQRNTEARTWDRQHTRPDPETFKRAILPALRHATLREMARATDLSSGYCSMIRRGKYVPHARHFEALARLSLELDAPAIARFRERIRAYLKGRKGESVET